MEIKKITIITGAIIFAACAYFAFQRYIDKHEQSQLLEINEIIEIDNNKVDAQEQEIAAQPEIKPIIDVATSDILEDLFTNHQEPMILFFYLENCGWCKKMKPVFEETAKNQLFAPIQFYTINGKTVQASAIAEKFVGQKISGFPTLFFMNHGKYIDKQVGFSQQVDFENKLKRIFNDTLILNSNKVSNTQDVEIQGCKCGGDGITCNTCTGNCGGCEYSNECNSGNCVNGLCYITDCEYGTETCGTCNSAPACPGVGSPCTGNGSNTSGSCCTDLACCTCGTTAAGDGEAGICNDTQASTVPACGSLSDGVVCTNTAQCMSGLECLNGACQYPCGASCQPCTGDSGGTLGSCCQEDGSLSCYVCGSQYAGDGDAGVCSNSSISTAPACGTTAPGEACTNSVQCTSGNECLGGLCAYPPCGQTDSPCTENSNCCSPYVCCGSGGTQAPAGTAGYCCAASA